MNRGFCDIYLIIPNKYKTFNHRKLSLYLFPKNCTIHAFRAPCLTKIKAFSKPEALHMPRPFVPVQYLCTEAAIVGHGALKASIVLVLGNK